VLQDKSGQFSFIVSVNHPDNRHWLLVSLIASPSY
jgi:hypothetical protein